MNPEHRALWCQPICESVGLTCSPEFLAALIPQPREKLVTGGTQAGKSTEGACEILVDLPSPLQGGYPDRNFRYWNIVPSYRSPHKEMDYLREWTAMLGIQSGSHFPEGDSCWLSLFGGRVVIETRTAQDPEGIAGEACDGVLVTEAGQMPESIRRASLERTMTRRGWVTYTGTLEDDEAKPRYAWYGEKAAEWEQDRNPDHAAFSLPSWSNLAIYPTGRLDPEIIRLEKELGEHAFNRRIAGIPSGVQFPVYPRLGVLGLYDKAEIPPESQHWIAALNAGGHDYGEGGTNHPSTLAAITVNTLGEAWVRECRENRSTDTGWIEEHRRDLSDIYWIPLSRWGYDPMQREAAKSDGAQVAGGTRLWRVGLVEARLAKHKLYFDLSGPGVWDAFRQMQRVHYRRVMVAGKGEVYEYERIADDLAAAIEDAIEVIDGGQKFRFNLAPPRGKAVTYTQGNREMTRMRAGRA